MRAEQIVSEMVAEALSDNTGRPFAEVLETPAGRRLVELAGGPARGARGPKTGAPLYLRGRALTNPVEG